MNKREEKIISEIENLLPDSSETLGTDGLNQRRAMVQQKAETMHKRLSAKELAVAKYYSTLAKHTTEKNEARKQAKTQEILAKREAIKKLNEEDKLSKVSVEEAVEVVNEEFANNPQLQQSSQLQPSQQSQQSQPPQPIITMASQAVRDIVSMQGTTRPEVVKLLNSLNINLDLQLTKTDTANLLACLLTANETQLKALYQNRKIPIAIKTVIKRIMDDSKLGNIETVEKLWDRVFGKAGMMLDLPKQTQIATGIIPNTPVSREAYILIRDTLLT